MQDSMTMAEVGSIVKVYADENAKHESDHHHGQSLPRQQDGEAVKQQAEGFHRD
jgi:hypothetical protein